MTPPLLEVLNLIVEFEGRDRNLRALDDISFTIAAGEIMGVVGESGAGKSLTGQAVLGLIDAPGRMTGGEIRFDGRRIDDLTPEALRRLRGRSIAAIFQDPLASLNPLHTIGGMLTETLRAHFPLDARQARERAIELLRQTGIAAPETRLDHYPHQFSGGMRQRVVIALALATEPRLIIADEPTTALDVSVQAQIIALLRGLARDRGVGVMLITHDMGVIAETCDRVAVMYAGRIVETGPVQDILHAPAHPYTAALMASIPDLRDTRPRLAQIDGAMPSLDRIPFGCPFHPRCPKSTLHCEAERPELARVRGTEAACWWPVGTESHTPRAGPGDAS